MDAISNALDDLKNLIIEGHPIEEALEEIAKEYELSATFLRNRARKAFGALEKIRENRIIFTESSKKYWIESNLNRYEYVIYNHNKSEPHQNDFLSEQKLIEVVNLANKFGGTFQIATDPIELNGFRIEPGFVYDEKFLKIFDFPLSGYPANVRSILRRRLQELKRGKLK